MQMKSMYSFFFFNIFRYCQHVNTQHPAPNCIWGWMGGFGVGGLKWVSWGCIFWCFNGMINRILCIRPSIKNVICQFYFSMLVAVIYSGYHEVPDKAMSRFSPPFQIEDRSREGIVIPPISSDGEGQGNATKSKMDDNVMNYLSADVKFTITVALSLITIIAVVYYFPKVRFVIIIIVLQGLGCLYIRLKNN